MPFALRLTLQGKVLLFSWGSEALDYLAWLIEVNNTYSLGTLLTQGFLCFTYSMIMSHILRSDDTNMTGSDRARGQEFGEIESFLSE